MGLPKEFLKTGLRARDGMNGEHVQIGLDVGISTNWGHTLNPTTAGLKVLGLVRTDSQGLETVFWMPWPHSPP